jgi:hypothetical protein
VHSWVTQICTHGFVDLPNLNPDSCESYSTVDLDSQVKYLGQSKYLSWIWVIWVLISTCKYPYKSAPSVNYPILDWPANLTISHLQPADIPLSPVANLKLDGLSLPIAGLASKPQLMFCSRPGGQHWLYVHIWQGGPHTTYLSYTGWPVLIVTHIKQSGPHTTSLSYTRWPILIVTHPRQGGLHTTSLSYTGWPVYIVTHLWQSGPYTTSLSYTGWPILHTSSIGSGIAYVSRSQTCLFG